MSKLNYVVHLSKFSNTYVLFQPLIYKCDKHLQIGGFFVLIKDLLKEFTFELQIKNYSSRTTETYNYNTTHFIQYLNEFHEVNEIEDVSIVHVKKYIQHQLNLGKKATYINTVIKSLRSFYTYLVAEEYVTLNIMARTNHQQIGNTPFLVRKFASCYLSSFDNSPFLNINFQLF